MMHTLGDGNDWSMHSGKAEKEKKMSNKKVLESAGDDTYENIYRKLRNDEITNQSSVNSAGYKLQRSANELLNWNVALD